MIKLNMKRFFMVMAVIFMSFVCFGQQWDNLNEICSNVDKHEIPINNCVHSSIITKPFGFSGKYSITNIYDDCGYTAITFSKSDDYNEHSIRLSKLDGNVNCRYNLSKKYIEFFPKTVEYTIPQSVYKNYKIGNNCFISGEVFITIGLLVAIPSAIAYGCYIKNGKVNEATGSAVAMSIGSSFVSVSIPLLCFGDHIKRECNMNFELYNLTK